MESPHFFQEQIYHPKWGGFSSSSYVSLLECMPQKLRLVAKKHDCSSEIKCQVVSQALGYISFFVEPKKKTQIVEKKQLERLISGHPKITRNHLTQFFETTWSTKISDPSSSTKLFPRLRHRKKKQNTFYKATQSGNHIKNPPTMNTEYIYHHIPQNQGYDIPYTHQFTQKLRTNPFPLFPCF